MIDEFNLLNSLQDCKHTLLLTSALPICVHVQGRDAEAAAGFIDEINLLNSLKGKPNIIQLVDAQVFTDEGLVYMVQVRRF